ncbi:prokineticin-2 [Aquarana catesbeiana]|uniref:prokineticin-2 n=1 Tax=Aquarana catesbeiana TaxID=8400 RepID=UPI003CC9D5C0
MRTLTCLLLLLVSVFLLLEYGDAAVITGACERDVQCGGGMCCAVSIWMQGLRICTPLGRQGEDCHPASRKVPFAGPRLHNSCPCQSNLACKKLTNGKYQCMPS